MEQLYVDDDGLVWTVHCKELVDYLDRIIGQAQKLGNAKPVIVLTEQQYHGLKAFQQSFNVITLKKNRLEKHSPLTGASWKNCLVIVSYEGNLNYPAIL